MQIKRNIAVSDSGFIFDANTGESYSVNRSGSLILKMLMDGKSKNDIIDKLLQEYEIESSILDHYIDDFSNNLDRFELIEKEDYEQ